MKKRITTFFTAIIILFLIYILGTLGLAYFTDFKPDDVSELPITKSQNDTIIEGETPYLISTFNIGYGALGKEQDFFMDKGKNSGAFTFDEVDSNISFIKDYLTTNDFDFVFLQEVDIEGKRSFNINQFAILKEGYYATFAKNYDVKYVPVPLTRPMGGAKSGLVTLSKALPSSAHRYSFAGKEMAIKQLFDLKRAFTIQRYPIKDNDNELVLINAHFSAFDPGGSIRKQQLEQIKSILVSEYEQGNYVILGGDFNHELPGTSATNFPAKESTPDWIMDLPSDFTPHGYHWAVDPQNPTVRALQKPYQSHDTFTAVIDGFLVSENIDILMVEGMGDFAFEHSDHNPVILKFSLKP